MGDTPNYVTAVTLVGTEKVRNPDKFYVYAMRITRLNKNISIVYRRYSELFEMHCMMIEEYKELVTAKPRWLPPMPRGGTLGRSNVAKVAESRVTPLREYMEAVMKLDIKYLSCDIMMDFFSVTDEDLELAKKTQVEAPVAENGAENIGGPVSLEEYVAIEDFTPKDKKGISLEEGATVEVIDKNNSGWWYISWSRGIGWVPANYLRPVEGAADEYTTCDDDNFYIAVNSFKAKSRDEVSFEKGDVATVQLTSQDGWWYIAVGGSKGFGPAQYLSKIQEEVLKEDLINNPPTIAQTTELPPRSNTHRRRSTRKAQKSLRTKRAPKAGNIPEEPPEGDNHVVVESYSSSGVGQISLVVGDNVIVTNKDKEEWWYVWKDSNQGWFPSSFLVSENAVKEPESFKVIANYKASSSEELSARKGQTVLITDQVSDPDWWFGRSGKSEGWIPASFLQKT